MATSIQVVFDCADPDRLATFWAAALGYKKDDPPAGYKDWPEWLAAQGVPQDQWNAASAIIDPEGQGARIYFQQVPEAKTVKNRLHLDINAGGGTKISAEERKQHIQAAIERLVGLGATYISEREQRGDYWIVMADPEGNEFCLQ